MFWTNVAFDVIMAVSRDNVKVERAKGSALLAAYSGGVNGLTVQGLNDIIPAHVENGGKRFL